MPVDESMNKMPVRIQIFSDSSPRRPLGGGNVFISRACFRLRGWWCFAITDQKAMPRIDRQSGERLRMVTWKEDRSEDNEGTGDL
jgi:hypothetical protein